MVESVVGDLAGCHDQGEQAVVDSVEEAVVQGDQHRRDAVVSAPVTWRAPVHLLQPFTFTPFLTLPSFRSRRVERAPILCISLSTEEHRRTAHRMAHRIYDGTV